MTPLGRRDRHRRRLPRPLGGLPPLWRDGVEGDRDRPRAEHGEAEGRAWGRWRAMPLSDGDAIVTYAPHTGNPAFADKRGERGSWRVTV